MVSVTDWCPITRQYNTMSFPITQQEYDTAMAAWKAGALIEHAFPMLNEGERQFLRTGMTPDVWESVFGNSDDK